MPPELTPFKNGFVLFKTKGKVGLLEKGQIKARPIYDEIKCWQYEEQDTSYLAVRKGALWGLLNRYGSLTTSIEYDSVTCASTRTANVMKNGRMLTLNGDGKEQNDQGENKRAQPGFVDPK